MQFPAHFAFFFDCKPKSYGIFTNIPYPLHFHTLGPSKKNASHGTRVKFFISFITMAAASGSPWKLNSAVVREFTFPIPKNPLFLWWENGATTVEIASHDDESICLFDKIPIELDGQGDVGQWSETD